MRPKYLVKTTSIRDGHVSVRYSCEEFSVFVARGARISVNLTGLFLFDWAGDDLMGYHREMMLVARSIAID